MRSHAPGKQNVETVPFDMQGGGPLDFEKRAICSFVKNRLLHSLVFKILFFTFQDFHRSASRTWIFFEDVPLAVAFMTRELILPVWQSQDIGHKFSICLDGPMLLLYATLLSKAALQALQAALLSKACLQDLLLGVCLLPKQKNSNKSNH